MALATSAETRVRGRVVLASPYGFCAGVERAIEAVERALERYGPPVYVRGQIIHSEHVLADLSERGAVFVASEDDVPDGRPCVLSAHGVAPSVRTRLADRDLPVIDATCPLVAKVHVETRRYARAGRTVILIGRRGHDEVVGTVGEAPDSVVVVENEAEVDALPFARDAKLAYTVQTTLSVDDVAQILARLRARFTDLEGPSKDDICYASQNRQAAVKAIASEVDLVLVAGARNSSNSNRLVEVARSQGVPAHLVPATTDLDAEWLEDAGTVGLSAGASAPRSLIDGVLERLASLGFDRVDVAEVATETVRFPQARMPA
jgi:4-hydroxy-3-methylbut-2-enyl diphosphate reductase